MISLIKVKVVGGRKNADFCEYRNKNGSYRRNYFICKKHDIHCVILLDPERGETSRGRAILILRQVVVILIVLH